jgi:FtsP/CotA-like multicopper oxidase with cupredoxin domain
MGKFFRFAITVQFVELALVAASAQVGNCFSYPDPGTIVTNPLDLYSQGGALTLALTLDYGVDSNGYAHFCYNDFADGVEAPTLRLNPSDTLNLTLTNNLNVPGAKPMRMKHPMNMRPKTVSPQDTSCSGGDITLNTTNLHFHGLNIPPVCHQDDVINTLIQPTDPPFQYQFQVPSNEPPGLYWYHPHPHGFTTDQVNGGASGALIVGGIENVKPQVSGLTEQVLLVRQQFLNPSSWLPGPYQLTLNFESVGQDNVLVRRALCPPACGTPAGAPIRTVLPYIVADPGEQQFWRVVNASTQAFLDLQVLSDDVPQNLELIAIDAVPVTNDPYVTDIAIPPAGRAEFVMTGPPEGSSNLFVNLGYDTGPVGNTNFPQVLANILTSEDVAQRKLRLPVKHHLPAAKAPPATKRRFASLATAQVTATRSLYFSEATEGTNGPTNYFLTVQGQTPHLFDPSLPPAIVTNVGAVEDWTIENHTLEQHAFHIHQIHFLVMAINGVPLLTPVMQDTVNVPYWDGTLPYPSVTVRMDFSYPEVAGTFVYHCHVLDHEDGGMMAEIQVNP